MNLEPNNTANESTPVRVLLITARADYGGGPEYVYRLLEGFSPAVHPFVAAPMDEPYFAKYAAITGPDRTITIPHRKFTLSDLFRLRRFVKRHNIDLIHSHGKGAGVYGRILTLLTGKPCVHTFHGIHIAGLSPLKTKIYAAMEKVLAYLTAVCISVSKSEQKTVLGLHICKDSKVTVILNGVDLSSNNASFCNEPFRVVTVTRFDPAKHTGMLTDIVKELHKRGEQNIFFTVLGDGPERKQIEEAVLPFGMVEFAGFVSNPSQHFPAMQCYLSTSLREGLPLAVLEAMSSGLPVVVSRVPGNIDTVEGNGILFDVHNPAEAVDALLHLKNNQSEWEKCSKAAKKRIEEEFLLSRTVLKNEKLYLSILKQKN